MDCLFVGCGAIAREYADAFVESADSAGAASDESSAAGDPSVDTAEATDTSGASHGSLRLTAVCDLDRERATQLADRVAEAGATRPHVYTDTAAMLASESAPTVCVLTNHASHAAITREALAADRHVFSQKPLALDASEARALVETAADRDLALGCAPISPHNPAQRRVARLLADERCGPVRLGYAHAHVGRVTQWHDRPASFLAVGPLYDGAVYPLTNLTAWFGPVERVRTADALDVWPPDERRPDGPTHYEATLAFAAGPVVRLTASFYAPHRSREFTSLELHGDRGSIYLADAGALADDPETVQLGPLGESYAPASAGSDRTAHLADGPARLAAAIDRGERPRRSARRAAHVVAICNAIERAAADGGPVTVPTPDGIESLSELARETES